MPGPAAHTPLGSRQLAVAPFVGRALRRRIPRQSRGLSFALLLAAIGTAGIAYADELPLRERIDALVEGASLGPIAAPASDADFLRRAYLDLNGTIPDAATARAFLDDPAPSKREALVDRLLARAQFARHMARVFDVLLLERRPQKSLPAVEWTISAGEWHEYLRKSFADNKPLNQLAREILAADGVDANLRPAAKFYFDREADPDLLARDIGRLFFGRDLQCAQCHDHPLVEDYLQSDYYGLKAFVSRGVLFDDAKLKKVYYAENAEGEVNFKSVFTGNARDRVLPTLLASAPVSEPVLAKEDAYVVAPAKDVRPIPKYSRRAQLAALATDGKNIAFNRNLANRMWAHMMGRGVTHPLDMQHSGNPAVQSRLLGMLADELARMKFDAKSLLRELALSRAYQRASETPAPADVKLDPAAGSSTLAAWKAEAARIDAELEALKTASSQAAAELESTYDKFATSGTARDAAEKARADAKKASDDISAALAAAVKEAAAKDDILKALVEARVKADAAVAKLPDDKVLADAAKQFSTRANEVDTQLAAVRKVVDEKTPQVQAASLALAAADKPLQAATAEVAVTRSALDAVEIKARDAQDKFRAAKASRGELTARIADGQAALDYGGLLAAAAASQAGAQSTAEQLTALKSQTSATADQLTGAEAAARVASEKASSEKSAADSAFAALAERATVRFTLAPLKPLTPEQMAWATMQAVGLVDAQAASLAEQTKKDVEAMANVAPEQRGPEEARLLEARVDEKLAGNIQPFVALFGQQPGQAATFQATVHQALFLANGGVLAGWLNPGGNNLTERLAKIEDPTALAEELYLNVLTRRATTEEQAQVAAYWEAAKADRAAAAREMVWALLASAEFRFNH